MPNNPKCLLFKLEPPATDSQVQAMVTSIPHMAQCVSCERRKKGELEKMCPFGVSNG